MLGFLVFHLLALFSVSVNALTDRGIAERRKLGSQYGSLLEAMADFEQGGGRVQELDHQAESARRTVRRTVAGPWVLAVVLTTGLTSIGASVWIPATIIAVYVAAVGAFGWLVSDLFDLADGSGPQSKIEITGALLALCLKGGIAGVGIAMAAHAISYANAGRWLLGIALMPLALTALAFCHLPVAMIDRHLRKLKEVDFARTTKTDAVLFLRSFGDDEVRLFSPYGSIGPRYQFIPGRRPFEQILAAGLFGRGKLIGVGKPGERLPTLGAFRTYWDHDNWKDAIRSTASRTDGLLVLAGNTPSLGWEISQLSDLDLLGKTLILFPPDHQVGTIERYSFVDEALKFEPKDKLPDDLKVALIAVGFDQGGRPIHYMCGGRDWSSYVVTLTHFQLVLDGDLQFDVAGAVSESVSLADDPFEQALYLLETGRREWAESILKEASPASYDVSTRIGRAWERVAFHEDLEGARDILSAYAGQHNSMIQRALEAAKSVETGGESRDILRARYPERFHARPNRIRVGSAKLSRRSAARFRRLIQQIETSSQSQAHESHFGALGEVLEIAEAEGISTLVAMAQVQLAQAELQRGNVMEATSLLREAVALREAPRVEISPVLPRLDPTDVIDEALETFVQMADQAKDVERRIAALKELLAFRVEYRDIEDAAWTAGQLGRSYGQTRNFESASHHLAESQDLYARVGRLQKVAEMAILRSLSARFLEQYEHAYQLAQEALEVSKSIDDPALELQALNELATLMSDPENPDRSVDVALNHYRAALALAKGLDQTSDVDRLNHRIRRILWERDTGTAFDLFNARSRRIAVRAQEAARDRGHGYIGAEHLLLGLLQELDGGGGSLLQTANVAIDDLQTEVDDIIGRTTDTVVGHIPFDSNAKSVLTEGLYGAFELGHHHVGSDHLLLGLTVVEGLAKSLLNRCGVTRDWVLGEMAGAEAGSES